jgi:hypothetical protein
MRGGELFTVEVRSWATLASAEWPIWGADLLRRFEYQALRAATFAL